MSLVDENDIVIKVSSDEEDNCEDDNCEDDKTAQPTAVR